MIMKQEHMDQIGVAVKAVAAKKDINHFYFVACGGSQAFMMPAQYMFDREIAIPASIYSSNEFVHRLPKALGPDSVVITCSHSGNTPETVKATEIAREKGATTIALSNLVDSPLWKAAEYPIHYDWGKEADASDLNKAVLYSLIFGDSQYGGSPATSTRRALPLWRTSMRLSRRRRPSTRTP